MQRRTCFSLLLTFFGALALIPTSNAQEDILNLASRGETQAVLTALDAETPINVAQADGTSLLHWAVYYDDLSLVNALLELGADARLRNNYAASPLSQAAITGNPEIIEALLGAGADANERFADGQTAIMVLARTNNLDAALVLLNRGADVNIVEQFRGQTALMWAAAQKQPEMLQLLLDHGAEPDTRSNLNNWQRQVTAEPRMKFMPVGGLTPLLYAAREGCLLCIQSLLAAGANIQMSDPEGISPLIMASLNANWDSARLLLDAGAYVNKWDIYGRSSLYATVDYNTIPHGGRSDRISGDLTSSLEFVELLLEAGANPNLQLKLFPPYRNLSADRGFDRLLKAGVSPLFRAARGADIEVVDLLLEYGALADLPNENNVSPLMVTAGYATNPTDTRGRFRTEREALVVAGMLLESVNVDVNHQDETGATALHGAAQIGWTNMVSLLIEHGSNPLIEDSFGTTALDYALGRGGRFSNGGGGDVHLEAATLLESL
ncbi:ankyrin repeat domain-containing protein [Haliea sp. AH-315-K21]|uniref:Uncharacterized protein n=1 Tax=SAR86 cluster bacterium TaxID=2030880 RepID=A0A2A5C961_9GAMM|nr:ankyrin repeat domain-containing protein [Haliea sp. AH-315-K21]PCJ40008.1 MAG: hypothetical protein COA71_12630 [SAR86 cluster bacterium]